MPHEHMHTHIYLFIRGNNFLCITCVFWYLLIQNTSPWICQLKMSINMLPLGRKYSADSKELKQYHK